MQADLDKEYYEMLWANNLVAEEHREAWTKLHSTHRAYTQVGDTFVVWRLRGGAPTQLKTFKVLTGEMSMSSGLSLLLEQGGQTSLLEQGGQTSLLEVTHQPTPLGSSDVFIWLPFFCNVRWTPKTYKNPKDERSIRLPICTKTKSNYVKAPSEGHVYVMPLSKFCQAWPQFKNTNI